MEQQIEKVVYTVPEVAKMLGVSNKSVYELIAQEKIKCIRVGVAIRIPKVYFDNFIRIEQA